MAVLLVIDNPKRFALHVPGVEVVAAREYLTNPRFSEMRRAAVFNLCRTHGYQEVGYYVSLLAAARGHRPLPSIATIQDLRMQPLVRVASQDMEELILSSLKPLKSDHYKLNIYFGRNGTKRYERLSRALFNQFPAPLLQATFKRHEEWELESLKILAVNDIPDEHRGFVLEQAQRYFERTPRRSARKEWKYDLAILVAENDPNPPSNPRAMKKFMRAAEGLGFRVELITKDDYGTLGEFDALFIRTTTAVNHYTFRFARRATAEGMVVIDDPDSILKCTNKVFVNELLTRHKLGAPKTIAISEDTLDLVKERIGFPCVVKKPDGSFSSGVVKFESEEEMRAGIEPLFEESELVIAQEFVPTAFDWRVGVLNGTALYVCRYYMAKSHWQIVKRGATDVDYGVVDAMRVEDAPPAVVNLGVRAARLMGDGLYGVDIKEVRGRPVVIEINDNPSIDAGFEDRILGDDLYERIMQEILNRLDARKR